MIGKHISFVALVVALQNASNADAFTPRALSSSLSSVSPAPPSSSSFSSSRLSTFRLFSSLDDDELFKMLGKRGGIRRKNKEDASNEDVTFEVNADDLDLDSEVIPEFTTKRSKRQSKKKDDDEDETPSSGNDDEAGFDYLADYDDENDFHIPNRIGVTTRCWGEEKEGFVPSGKLKKKQLREGKFVPGDLQMSYNKLLEDGILLFETSPAYGRSMAKMNLSAEDILSTLIKEHRESDTPPLIVDTFDNKIWERTKAGLTSALTASCEKLDQSVVDVYQTKNIGWLPSGGIIKGMADAVLDEGTTNFVGVQNVSPLRMRRLNQKLDSVGLSITTNAFEFSLTNQKKKKWIESCKTLGVVPLIRNPLGSGLASGQYTATNPSGGVASAGSKYSFKTLEKYQPLHSMLESVAERVRTRLLRKGRKLKGGRRGEPEKKVNTDITTAQIAWNYVIAKGAVPLAEVNSPKDAEQLAGCLGWSLSDEEVSMLESAAELCS